MTDEDILNTLYNYIKLVKPEVKISLARYITKYIFVNGPIAEFMHIYCKNGELIVQATDKMKFPSWFKELFHYRRVTLEYVSHKIPPYIRGLTYRYYSVEVKDKKLLG